MNYLSKSYILMMVLLSNVMYAMELSYTKIKYGRNTYKGQVITPKSLLELQPKMPHKLKKEVKECMAKYHVLINQLVTRPHPLTHENRKQKTKDNFAIIQEYEDKGEVKKLGKDSMNYVLRFRDYPGFTMPINRWGSCMAYLFYASGQGSVLDPNFKADEADCSKMEYLPSYQACSRQAHYLRLSELIEKDNCQSLRTTPTYLVHIPGKPKVLSDENYVPVQLWVPGLRKLKELPTEEQHEIRKNISPSALKEIHDATIYAALWDVAGSLCVDNSPTPHYYMIDLEEPFNHKPQFFYFRGEEGTEKYVEDVIGGLERVAKFFLIQNCPEQLERWKILTEANASFKALCRWYNKFPNFDPEYLPNM